ncbi:hypothetical protein KY289_005582 [Solanum tuberosum]|nr:hypothetical protein KY289_005582 [Solanum tuberosum]
MMRFESLKGFYYMDSDFKDTFDNLSQGKRVDRYQLVDGFLFKDGRACVPMSSWRELFVKEAHSGGLMGHFGMKHDVERICGQCLECKQAKSTSDPKSLWGYTWYQTYVLYFLPSTNGWTNRSSQRDSWKHALMHD